MPSGSRLSSTIPAEAGRPIAHAATNAETDATTFISCSRTGRSAALHLLLWLFVGSAFCDGALGFTLRFLCRLRLGLHRGVEQGRLDLVAVEVVDERAVVVWAVVWTRTRL